MRLALMVVLILALVLPALAACPDVKCPIDGANMMNTWECNKVGDTHTCRFEHQTYDPRGNEVTHYVYVQCE